MKVKIIFISGTLLGLAVSALEFVKMCAEQLEYTAFFKIASPLFIILTICALYWGLKEIRTECYQNSLKFSKAFLYGCGISFVAFFIVFLYFLLHYSYIDVDGLQRISSNSSALPALTNIFSASLMLAFYDLLYGIFFTLFVAMYVYKRKE